MQSIIKDINLKNIISLTGLLIVGLAVFATTRGKHPYVYGIDANSTKTYEWRDYNVIDDIENTCSIESDDELSIRIISTDFSMYPSNRDSYRLVRFEVSTPDLWVPQTFKGKIISTNEQKAEEYKMMIQVNLSKSKWQIYGLITLLISIALFIGTYYVFKK